MTTMPTRVGTAFQTSGSGAAGTPVNVTTGAIAAGSWMIAVVIHNSTSVTEVTPDGWTVLVPGTNTNAQIGTRRYAIFGKIHGQFADGSADSSDAGKTFWSFVLSSNNTVRVVMYWGTGAKPVSSWIVGTPRKRAGTTAEQSIAIAPSVTTTEANSLAIALHMEATSAAESDITSLSGATRWNFSAQGTGGATGVIETVMSSYIEKTAVGATGDVTVTYPNTQTTNAGGVQIVLPPVADVGPPPGLSVSIRTASNTNTTGQMYLWNGTTGVAPTSLRAVRNTVASSADLLAKPGFTVAHRLGSVNWPEHSMHGATQSLIRGVDALEFSVAKTIDNVYFGLHDSTLDRTSGVSGVDPKTLTWAQVQQYQLLASITDTPSQPNRPYLRLVDVLAAYPKAVFFIDPKNLAFSDMIALFTWLKNTYANATDRFVLKYYYDYTNLKNTVMNMGFKSWGYLYTSDISNANFATYCQRWTWLGLENSATQANWDLVKAQNPLVLGHIAATLAAFESGISKGAVGGMVSGVKQVKGF